MNCDARHNAVRFLIGFMSTTMDKRDSRDLVYHLESAPIDLEEVWLDALITALEQGQLFSPYILEKCFQFHNR